MILKIVCNYEGRKWWLYDKIDRVVTYESMTRRKYDERYKIVDVHAEIFSHGINCKNECGTEDGCVECPRVSVLCVRFSNNEESLISFDTKAYVCSDSGKTLEIIAAT